MKKLFISLLALIMMLSAFVSCGDDSVDSSLLDAWSMEKNGVVFVMTLAEDGKATINFDAGTSGVMDAKYKAKNGKFTLTFTSGTETMTLYDGISYKVEGDTLTVYDDSESIVFTRGEKKSDVQDEKYEGLTDEKLLGTWVSKDEDGNYAEFTFMKEGKYSVTENGTSVIDSNYVITELGKITLYFMGTAIYDNVEYEIKDGKLLLGTNGGGVDEFTRK